MEVHFGDGEVPLTPGHFLTGVPLVALSRKLEHAKTYTYGRRRSYLQKLTVDLWRRWQKEYILLLQKRAKWKDSNSSISVGDLVVNEDTFQRTWNEDTFQRTWPLARVTVVYPGTH